MGDDDEVADIDDIAVEVLVTPKEVAVIFGVIVSIAVTVKNGLKVCEFFEDIVLSKPLVGVNTPEIVPLCEFIGVPLECTDSLEEPELNAVLDDVRLIRALEDIESNVLDVNKLEREGKNRLPVPFGDRVTLGDLDDDDDKLDDDDELVEDLGLCETNKLTLIRGVLLNNEVPEDDRLTLGEAVFELLKYALLLNVFCIELEDDSDGDISLLEDIVPPPLITSVVNVAFKDACEVREKEVFVVTVGTSVVTAEDVTSEETLNCDVDVTVTSCVDDGSKEKLELEVINTDIVPTAAVKVG